MKRLFITLFLLISIAGSYCYAQDSDASWLHNELWVESAGGPIIGPIYDTKYYFSEDGRFYAGHSYRSRNSFDFIQEASSGEYEYEPETRKIILYTDNIDSIRIINIFVDSVADNKINIKFDKEGWISEWHRLKGKFTFAMKDNSIIFRANTIMVCTEINRCHSNFTKSNIPGPNDNEKKEILDILKSANYSGRDVSKVDWQGKADFILFIENDYGERAIVYFKEDNSQIFVDANDGIMKSSRLYNISETQLGHLIEIAEKYIQ